jgi:hypothetical protein
VELLGLAQPQVSKHLREVDLVHVRDEGRQRMYRLNAEPLKGIHDWLAKYEQSWNTRFDLLDDVLDELKEAEKPGGPGRGDRLRNGERHAGVAGRPGEGRGVAGLSPSLLNATVTT